ncbi:MAG: TspO/MBR family protein [Candidatus Baltobacteraceae bacterium]
MKRQWKWWHGAVFYGGVLSAGAGLRRAAAALVRDRDDEETVADRAAYERERLPVFAPPGAAFPIAWGINSLCSIAGSLRVANLPLDTPGRAEYLRTQMLAWMLFATFEAAYFGLRSPINAAGVTVLYSAATGLSLYVALAKLREPIAAWSLAPTLAWLALANPVGLTQAAWNEDRFWRAGPFLEPPPNLLKRSGRDRL